jgi:LysM repeat protein
MQERKRSPLRLLAPLALVVFVLALFVVLTSADVGGGGDTRTSQEAQERDLGDRSERTTTEPASREDRLPDETYIVKAGDTLGTIAERVGLTVERLMELNPDLDPQALVSGQKIKLRE